MRRRHHNGILTDQDAANVLLGHIRGSLVHYLEERESWLREELRACREALKAVDGRQALPGMAEARPQPRKRGGRPRVRHGASPEMEALVENALASTGQRYTTPELAERLGISTWSVRRAAQQSSRIAVEDEPAANGATRRRVLYYKPPAEVPERALIQHSEPWRSETE